MLSARVELIGLQGVGSEISQICNSAHEVATKIWELLSETRRLAAGLMSQILDAGRPSLDSLGEVTEVMLVNCARIKRENSDLLRYLATAMELNPTFELEGIEIDASGADLSDVYLPDIEIVDRVIWTRDTRWPKTMEDEVQRYSGGNRPRDFSGTKRQHDPIQSVLSLRSDDHPCWAILP